MIHSTGCAHFELMDTSYTTVGLFTLIRVEIILQEVLADFPLWLSLLLETPYKKTDSIWQK